MEVLPGEALVLQVGDVRAGRPIHRDEQLRWEFSWSFVSFLMTQKMLRGITDSAEALT